MASEPLVDPGRVKVRLGDYGTAQATALRHAILFSRAQDYRRRLSAPLP